MRALVRDDIISLDSFVQAKFKFEKYLILLKDAGNYCFLDQFKRLFQKGDSIAKNMEEYNLIKTETLNNNYKYIYLTDTAMKYIILKDDAKNYDEVVKNKISVMKVNKYPTEKVLMSSALKFQLLANDISENRMFIKVNLINNVRESFYKQNLFVNNKIKIFEVEKEIEAINLGKGKACITQTNTIQLLQDILSISFMQQENLCKVEIDKCNELKELEEEFLNLSILDIKRKKEIPKRIIVLKYELEKTKVCIELKNKVNEQIKKAKIPLNFIDEKLNTLKKQIVVLNKEQIKANAIEEQFTKLESKILNMFDKSKIVAYFIGDELQFKILDTGNTKTAFGYLKMISELKKFYTFDKVSISIISYSLTRSKNLINEFNDTQIQKNKALKTMINYETSVRVTRKSRKSWKYTPDFYLSAETIYCNTPEVNKISYDESTIALEIYKKNLSMSQNYIRNKDKKAIENLKEIFKEKSQNKDDTSSSDIDLPVIIPAKKVSNTSSVSQVFQLFFPTD